MLRSHSRRMRPKSVFVAHVRLISSFLQNPEHTTDFQYQCNSQAKVQVAFLKETLCCCSVCTFYFWAVPLVGCETTSQNLIDKMTEPHHPQLELMAILCAPLLALETLSFDKSTRAPPVFILSLPNRPNNNILKTRYEWRIHIVWTRRFCCCSSSWTSSVIASLLCVAQEALRKQNKLQSRLWVLCM